MALTCMFRVVPAGHGTSMARASGRLRLLPVDRGRPLPLGPLMSRARPAAGAGVLVVGRP